MIGNGLQPHNPNSDIEYAAMTISHAQFPQRPRMLSSYLLDQITRAARRLCAQADSDPMVWQDRLDSVREALGMSKVPEYMRPVGTKLGVIQWQGLDIEKHSIRLSDDLEVPVDMYLPRHGVVGQKRPGVLHIPGHWMENGKLEPGVQTNAVVLAEAGFIVAVCDPQDQGDRFNGWCGHSGTAQIMKGISQLGAMLAEYQALLTWLSARADVDEGRVVVTGASGGGLASLFMPLVDDRVRAIAPVCYVVELENMLGRILGFNWNGGGDLCNQIPRIADITTMSGLLCMKPAIPTLLVTAEDDAQFPVESARRSADQARRWRTAIAGSSELESLVVPGPHGYSLAASLAVRDFFLRVFDLEPILASSGSADETSVPQTPVVSVNYIAAAASTRTNVVVQSLLPDTPPPTTYTHHTSSWARNEQGNAETEQPAQLTQEYVERFFELYDPHCEPAFIEREWRLQGGRTLQRIAITPEPGITIPLWLSVPSGYGPCPVRIIFGAGGIEATLNHPALSELWTTDAAIAIVELRGHGETGAVDFEVATTALMLRRHLFSQRVADIRAMTDYLAQKASLSRQLTHWAMDIVAIDTECSFYTSVAAVTDARIRSLFFIERPVDWIEVDPRSTSYGVLVPGVGDNVTIRQVLWSRPELRVGTYAAHRPLWRGVEESEGSLNSWLSERRE